MNKKLRLKKPSDFKKAYKEGTKLSSPHFVLYARKNGLSNLRVGVAIAKRHVKLATQRNKIRRAAKEFLREKISRSIGGYDFVVASRLACNKENTNETIKEVKELLLKLKN